jgi:hypothetical protein
MTSADYCHLVSRADLCQPDPAWTPGLLIGNGQMSALVRVVPHAIRLSVRRNDIFAGEAPLTAEGWDNAITLEIDWGSPVFAQGAGCVQRLSLYSAEWSLQGPQISVRCLVAADHDLLALEIADHRAASRPLKVTLMAGEAPPNLGEQVGAPCSRVGPRQNGAPTDCPPLAHPNQRQAHPPYALQRHTHGLTLVQRYAAGDYSCSAALAVRAPQPSPQSVTDDANEGSLLIDAGGKAALLLAASAAAWSPDGIAGERVNALLDGLTDASFDRLRREHTARWEAFWQERLGNLLAAQAPAAWLRSLYLERAAPHWRSLPESDALLLAPPVEGRTVCRRGYLAASEPVKEGVEKPLSAAGPLPAEQAPPPTDGGDLLTRRPLIVPLSPRDSLQARHSDAGLRVCKARLPVRP